MSYNLFKYKRVNTTVANIGNVSIGGTNPIRIQTMVTTLTSDIDATVEQCINVIKAGAEIVRITVPTKKDAEHLNTIKQKLDSLGFSTPLVADIHFNPEAALAAAKYVAKVRINPGNFADKQARLSEQIGKVTQSDASVLKEKFLELLEVCKEHKTAIRIGTNHGSLSSRIMEKYGDTPQGMVESAMEFLRICKDENFTDVVVSMKASNTRVMVHAYRLLVQAMKKEGMNYPLHLGVTEAGDGEDGRVKSAAGMGTLLADGIGDTLRVSLTETPENEIPVAKMLVDHFSDRDSHARIREVETNIYNPFEYNKRESHSVDKVGGKNPAVVVADLSTLNPIHQSDIEYLGFILKDGVWISKDGCPDYIYTGTCFWDCTQDGLSVMDDDSENILFCAPNAINDKAGLDWIKSNKNLILIVESENINKVADLRAFFIKLASEGITNPVIMKAVYNESSFEALQIKSACDLGALFIDGFGEGIMLDNKLSEKNQLTALSFSILQASRVRFTKTEFIACPGCGRTLFGLRETLEEVRGATSHLKGLKIGIMGCIVNGPGEMADADYGYVGIGKGKVSLYKGKQPIKNNISQENAISELISLIKENGDWQERE